MLIDTIGLFDLREGWWGKWLKMAGLKTTKLSNIEYINGHKNVRIESTRVATHYRSAVAQSRDVRHLTGGSRISLIPPRRFWEHE